MTVFVKRAGTLLAGFAIMIGVALAIGTQNFQPNEIRAEGPSSLHQSFSFIDGGSSTNSGYANTNLATNISYASDNPGGTSGTTAWEADYANLSLTHSTRLGGKLLSEVQTDNTTPWCNIRTNFPVTVSVDVVTIRDAQYFTSTGGTGLARLTGLYLQSSLDGLSWATVKTLSIPSLTVSTTAVGDGINIVFDGFTIPANSYIRFGVGLTALSAANEGFQFGGIAFNSYTLCV